MVMKVPLSTSGRVALARQGALGRVKKGAIVDFSGLQWKNTGQSPCVLAAIWRQSRCL
jgi:hypothetical protein